MFCGFVELDVSRLHFYGVLPLEFCTGTGELATAHVPKDSGWAGFYATSQGLLVGCLRAVSQGFRVGWLVPRPKVPRRAGFDGCSLLLYNCFRDKRVWLLFH